MARKAYELVKCDRCKREELQPIPATPKKSADFSAELLGDKIAFNDLCAKCSSTVRNVFEDLKEWDRDIIPRYKVVDEVKAPPLQVAPDYTPPKPHSAGAAKK